MVSFRRHQRDCQLHNRGNRIQVPHKLMPALAFVFSVAAISFLMNDSAADPAPAISVVSVFLHGTRYPDAPHHLKLRLDSALAEVSTEPNLPVFSEFKPTPDFALPLNGDLRFSVTEKSRPLIRVTITKSGDTLNVSHSCRVHSDVANSYPYKGFASYIPPGTLLLMCSTDIGLIEIRLGCSIDSSAPACGLRWNAQAPGRDAR